MTTPEPCIYALIDPTDGRTYYIGRTINLKLRLNAHYASALAPDSHNKYPTARWLDELRRMGHRPQVVILQVNPTDGLVSAERRWITFYLRRKEPLLNLKVRDGYRQLMLPFPSLIRPGRPRKIPPDSACSAG